MKRRVHPKFDYSVQTATEPKQSYWIYIVITLFAAAILALGFFLAARQHFSAMELSFRNSAMRQQLTELEAEQRRLTLAREIARSPAEIKRAARKLGFYEASPEIAFISNKLERNQSGPKLISRTALSFPAGVSANDRPAARTAHLRDVNTNGKQLSAGSVVRQGRADSDSKVKTPVIARNITER